MTTGPSQALYFMNGPFAIRQAEALAERLRAVDGGDARRIEQAYRLAFTRSPTDEERDDALAFLRDYSARTSAPDPVRQAWPAFCQALFASAEFRYLD
jgi:Protein of unknown function (DUF1553)